MPTHGRTIWTDSLKNLFERSLTDSKSSKDRIGMCLCDIFGTPGGSSRKVEVIVNFPTSKNRRELMHFLGMASYYRKFCKNFSLVAEPLTRLLCKDQPFTWNINCVGALRRSKDYLCQHLS